jgi:hypothetical protein
MEVHTFAAATIHMNIGAHSGQTSRLQNTQSAITSSISTDVNASFQTPWIILVRVNVRLWVFTISLIRKNMPLTYFMIAAVLA